VNKEEEQYLPYLKAALEMKGYPTDAATLTLESQWATHIIGDAWRNHVPYENAKQWFERRWLTGPMKCYWLWHPKMDLENLPQDVARRADEEMKRRKPAEPSVSIGFGFSSYKKPSC
jgi:hypothetical protein